MKKADQFNSCGSSPMPSRAFLTRDKRRRFPISAVGEKGYFVNMVAQELMLVVVLAVSVWMGVNGKTRNRVYREQTGVALSNPAPS